MDYRKNILKLLTLIIIFIATVLFTQQNYIWADWWQRGEERPTPPGLDRDGRIILPTIAPTSSPTIPPIQPTATPKIGGPSVTPVPTGTSGSSSTDDPCGPGKSYTGPYCGWSPSTSSSGGGNAGSSPRIGGGPQVLGLSYTGGEGITWSDIISLTGVLCLLLYARSKMTKEIRV